MSHFEFTAVYGLNPTTVVIIKDGLMKFIEMFGKEVDILNEIADKSPKYKKVAEKLSALYFELYSNISVFSDKTATSDRVLSALQNCLRDIKDAEADGEFANHRGFARNTPVLLHLLTGVDVLRNLFDFLDKKIGKIVSGDKTPVFNNSNEFCVGIFKSANTATASKIETLKKDIQWFIRTIEKDENAAHAFDPKWKIK